MFCHFFSSKIGLQKCFAIFSHRKWVCKNVLQCFPIENGFAKVFCHFFSSKMGLQKCFAIFSHRKWVCRNVLPFFLIENEFAKMFCNVFQSKMGLQKCFAIFSHRKWVCKNVLPFFLIENGFAKMFCDVFQSKMGGVFKGVFNILCQGYFCQLVNLTININNHITNLEKYSLSLYGCLICLAVYIVLILKN